MIDVMKIALLGTGKTGGKVSELLGKGQVTEFDSANPPSTDGLAGHDAVISFLPGPAFASYIDLLVKSGIPVATGSTGFEWPADIDSQLKNRGVAWVAASNFSLGMNLVHGMITVLAKAPKIFDNYQFKLHEVHHIHKKDHPSGTALTWKKWLGQPVDFSYDRTGETIGDHTLKLELPSEDITIMHHAKDRKIYAEGAIWTAQKLVSGSVPPGLHELADIMSKELDI